MPSWLPHLRLARPLCWVLPALALGCGTQGATPLPEPPALNPDKIVPQTGIATPAMWPALFLFVGEGGAAPPRATVSVTNLDDQRPSFAANSNDLGAFSLQVVVSPGDELRFEAILENQQRSAPLDFVFGTSSLTPSERFGCVTLQPGLGLPFAAAGPQRFVLVNDCPTSITVQSASERLSLADFTLTTTLPLAIPAGDSATLSVEFAPSSTPPQQDVLFLVLDDGSRALRYPITLYRR